MFFVVLFREKTFFKQPYQTHSLHLMYSGISLLFYSCRLPTLKLAIIPFFRRKLLFEAVSEAQKWRIFEYPFRYTRAELVEKWFELVTLHKLA